MDFLALGGSLWDTIIEIKTPLHGNDCYPSNIFTIPGGTARNFSEAIARLGIPISLVTATGLDGLEKTVPEPGRVIIANSKKSSHFIAILNLDKSRVFSFNDTLNIDNLTTEEIFPFICNCTPKYIFIDTNLSENVIEFILKWGRKNSSITMVDPIAPSKVKKINGMLEYIDILSISKREFEVLNLDNLRNETTVLLKKGPAGVDIITKNQKYSFESIHKGPIISDNGAGDSFNAGFLYGVIKGYSINEQVYLGLKAASMSLLTHLNVNPELYKILL